MTGEGGTHMLDVCSPILVGGFDLVKDWKGTHSLDVCSPILVSGSHLGKDQRGTHSLNACSPILVSSSDLVKTEGTHILQPFSSVVSIWSSIGEGLTFWCSLIFISGSDPVKHWRAAHSLDKCLPLVSDSPLLKHWRLTAWKDVHPFSSIILKHWRKTHSLHANHPF